jgi:DNA modification methylase
METDHRIILGDARSMGDIGPEAVEFVVTSPPYPMIEMWDECFIRMNPAIGEVLAAMDGWGAFELMHEELDKVWHECFRVLRPGSLICVNIGDAVRTLGDNFQMFCNQARITLSMRRAGFVPLPDILWRKQTNAPNKFMGSGMLPVGAYVTYEHEYILIFRKGGKRAFTGAEERANRRRSAFFWEERNRWFSDVWMDLKGTQQEMGDQAARKRSAAYPFELAYRLILMHSVYGDTVLDPFLGTGTTGRAAIAAARNSVGCEWDATLMPVIGNNMSALRPALDRVLLRLSEHRAFMNERADNGSAAAHASALYGFPVVSAQERDIELYVPRRVTKSGAAFRAEHELARGDLPSATYGAPEQDALPLFAHTDP